MTSPRLNLLVIRSEEPARAIGFYELLGLRFQEEQHGKGTVHWGAEFGSLSEILDEVVVQLIAQDHNDLGESAVF